MLIHGLMIQLSHWPMLISFLPTNALTVTPTNNPDISPTNVPIFPSIDALVVQLTNDPAVPLTKLLKELTRKPFS